MNIAVDQQDAVVLDAAVATLVRNKRKWARTDINERIEILAEIKDRLLSVSEQWARIASAKKLIPEGSPLEGEEWISGPNTVMAACNALMHTLIQMKDKEFLSDLPVRQVGEEQISVRVLPNSIWDHLLLSGIKADVWMQPGVTKFNLHAATASAYDIPQNEREGSVSVVLGRPYA